MHARETRDLTEQARAAARPRPADTSVSLFRRLHETAGNGAVASLFVQRMLRAAAPAFVPGAHTAVPTVINSDTFQEVHGAGRTRIAFVKWWTSSGFPGRNIELMVYVGATAWALVHIKWPPGAAPATDNVSMATFKAPDNTSIPNGNIWGGSVRDILVAEALRHVGSLTF